MRKAWMIFCLVLLIPSLCSAAENLEKKRGIFAGIAHLEGRGLSNVFLFPAEWGHLPKADYAGSSAVRPVNFKYVVMPFDWFFVGLTHFGGRLFSGIGDMVVLPLAYPFSKYDDSLPVGMGWGEFPWQKGDGN